MNIKGFEAQELLKKRELTELEDFQLYHWYWGSNYSPSSVVQEMRKQAARLLNL